MRYVHCESPEFERSFKLAKDLYRVMNTADVLAVEFNSHDVDFDAYDDNEYKLYFTGEVNIPWEYRCEPKYPVLYRRICESLVRDSGKYKLKVDSDDLTLPKGAFYKISSVPSGTRRLRFRCVINPDFVENKN